MWNHLQSFLTAVLIKVCFLISGKNQICVLFIKRWQTINNYQPVPLLPVCGKIFTRLIVNCLYKYLEDKLLSVHQYGLWSSDSSVNQLLPIVLNLYKAFNTYPSLETYCVFLDISKDFEKVWHEGLVFKLKSVGVSDSLVTSYWLCPSCHTKWPDVWMLTNQGKCAKRLHPWTTFFSYLY